MAVRSDAGGGSHRRSPGLLAALAGLTVVLAVLVPLAPVVAEQPVVSWPATGQAARSTVLPLAPYRPLQLDATVPCAALRALDVAGGGEALRTVPATADEAAEQGLTVAVDAGRVRIDASGSRLLAEPLPAGDCTYRVLAGATGTQVERDGRPRASRAGILPPQVAQLATETGAVEAAAAGLAVTLHPDDRYASQPSALKRVLLVAHLLALAATLVLAVRLWRGHGPQPVRPVRLRLSWADAVVVAVSAAWTVLGPVNWDDGWYALMARNAGESGYLGNYIYMFNTSENPFVASQYLLQLWGTAGGWGLAWLRLLPLLYGLATWALLRVLLATALGRVGRLRRVPWLLLVAHLLWWLPYGMMLRPEPLIALCAAGVLLLAELARQRRSLGMLALATSVAALALTVSPSGAVAAAPLVMTLPWLLRLLREWSWAQRLAAVLVAAAAASIAVPVGFADASLGEVADATVTHGWYYLTYPWYQEIVHYDFLLRLGDTGVWGRRAPVVLTLAVLVVVAIGSGRRAAVGDPVWRLVLTGAITTAVAFALLTLTPTKWVNHFGSLGAVGTVLLTAALLRSPLPRRAGPAARATAVLVIAGGAALVLAGPNLWRPYSDWGQPFGNHLAAGGDPLDIARMAPHLGPVYLRNPLLWFAVAGALAAAIAAWRRRGRQTALTTDRGLLLGVCGLSVVLLLVVFGYAPLRQYPGWTVGLSNLRALAGQGCGLATGVQVLVRSGPQPAVSGGDLAQSGDFTLAVPGDSPVSPPSAGPLWHDVVGQPRSELRIERGWITTPWFALPDSAATHLVVPVAAGTVEGQRVMVQFGTGDPAHPVPGRSHTLSLDAEVAADTWQEVPVALPGGGASAVRLVAADRVTGAGSWLAVAAPGLGRWQPVEALTRGEPVFADQLSAMLWPCVDQVAIRHGIVQPPSVRLLADDGIPEFVLANPVDPLWGGSFVQAAYTATYVQPPSRIHPAGPPTRPWGTVQRVAHDHPVGLVELRVERGLEAGWHREPALIGAGYSGRRYIG